MSLEWVIIREGNSVFLDHETDRYTAHVQAIEQPDKTYKVEGFLIDRRSRVYESKRYLPKPAVVDYIALVTENIETLIGDNKR